MKMAEDLDVQIPPGWDVKYDEKTKRNYFVDHVTKKTQWDDPRLNHPFIWGEQEMKKLTNLQKILPEMPEKQIRWALLKTNFDPNRACIKLSDQNNKLNVSRTGSSKRTPSPVAPAKRTPSAVSGPKSPIQKTRVSDDSEDESDDELSDSVVAPNVAKNQDPKNSVTVARTASGRDQSQTSSTKFSADEFAFMSLRSKFSTMSDVAIKRALSIHLNDEKAATKYLKELHEKELAGNQQPIRIDLNIQEKAALKEAKLKEMLNQLKNEYPTVLEFEMKEILVETSALDLSKARDILRKKEADQRMEQFKSAAAIVAPLSDSAIPEHVETHTDDKNVSTDRFIDRIFNKALKTDDEGTTKTGTLESKNVVLGQKSVANGRDPNLVKGPDRQTYKGPDSTNLQYGSYRKYISTA